MDKKIIVCDTRWDGTHVCPQDFNAFFDVVLAPQTLFISPDDVRIGELVPSVATVAERYP